VAIGSTGIYSPFGPTCLYYHQQESDVFYHSNLNNEATDPSVSPSIYGLFGWRPEPGSDHHLSTNIWSYSSGPILGLSEPFMLSEE